MAKEIEKKFLVDIDKWNQLEKPKPTYLKQAYIVEQDLKVVRVRIKEDEALLTIKGPNKGIERLEFEYSIPKSDAIEMIDQFGGPVIEKDRFIFQFGKHSWEIDVFYGDNEGLIVAEVELSSSDEKVIKPDFIGQEVSNDPKYYNSSLQANPLKNWR